MFNRKICQLLIKSSRCTLCNYRSRCKMGVAATQTRKRDYDNNKNSSNNNYSSVGRINIGRIAIAGCCLWFYDQVNSSTAVQCSTTDSLKPPKDANFIADVVERVSNSVVYIQVEVNSQSLFGSQHGSGSGFIVRDDGLILTNLHVVGPAMQTQNRCKLQVQLWDGRSLDAKVIAYDPHSDMALLKVSATNLPVMSLGDSSKSRRGEWVMAIGAPLQLTNSVTVGVLSATGRNLQLGGSIGGLLRGQRSMEYLQTDAVITFGNSGGPLVNLEGKAIGINTLKVDTGFSFAIPIDIAKTFIQEATSSLKASGQQTVSSTTKPTMKRYFGVSILTLTPNLLTEFQRVRPDIVRAVSHGVLVQSVHYDSPAARSGLHSGDVIVKIEDKVINSTADVYGIIESSSGRIKVEFVREGVVKNVLVTLE